VRLLLDTHIWLWSLLDPERLHSRVIESLESPDSEIWLSPISIWELTMLADKGRVTLDLSVDAWIAEAFDRAPLHEAHLTFEVAATAHQIELPHPDPADRFLAATAKVLDLTLVTADKRLLALQDLSLMANR